MFAMKSPRLGVSLQLSRSARAGPRPYGGCRNTKGYSEPYTMTAMTTAVAIEKFLPNLDLLMIDPERVKGKYRRCVMVREK
jgi:hypothetical protein